VRTDEQGKPRVHSTDPLLYRGGTFLLKGDPHRRAVALLDQFLTVPDDRPIHDPLKRLFFQRDLCCGRLSTTRPGIPTTLFIIRGTNDTPS